MTVILLPLGLLAFLYALTLCSVAVHEAAHYVVMRKMGITINRVVICGTRWKRQWGNVEVSTGLLPVIRGWVNAKVPDDLSRADRMRIYLSGPYVETIFVVSVLCGAAYWGYEPVMWVAVIHTIRSWTCIFESAFHDGGDLREAFRS